MTDEGLCDLIEGVKNSLSNEFVLQWCEFARNLNDEKYLAGYFFSCGLENISHFRGS